MNKNYLIAGAAVLGVAGGFYAGYKFAEKKFDEELDIQIVEAKDFYAKANKSGAFSTPEGAAEALGVVSEAADALLEYQGVNGEQALETFAEQHKRLADEIRLDAREPIGEIVENVFVKPGFVSTPSDDAPYVIPFAEWMENDDEHDQTSLTWYEGDRVLADERDEPVEKVEDILGYENLECFGLGSDDDNVVLIRNKRMKTDFEVSRSTGKFTHEVLGFEHSDATFEKRPRRTQWDD